LIGETSGETYRQGQMIELKLAEANPASGALRFELAEGAFAGPRRPNSGRDGPRRDRTLPRGPGRGRPANIRHQGKKRR
ncbi:MAG TPA: ribonuclease R, partial [Sphingomicrobium sp.]|nr:ribonuclease R [Sphingomicrobium sp.]